MTLKTEYTWLQSPTQLQIALSQNSDRVIPRTRLLAVIFYLLIFGFMEFLTEMCHHTCNSVSPLRANMRTKRSNHYIYFSILRIKKMIVISIRNLSPVC